MALTTYPASVTSGAINAKGSYTQVVASTPYASSRLSLIVMYSPTAGNRLFLMDLAVGAASAESVIVPDLPVHNDTDWCCGSNVAIDVDIPAGSRLAIRTQCQTATTVLVVTVVLEGRALGALATPVTYGTVAGSSRGLTIDPGTTINTKGAYVQLSASTSARIDAVVLGVTPNQSTLAFAATTIWAVDVATGGAGAETVVIADLSLVAGTNADGVRPGLIRLPVSIPAGTRLAVRCSCNRNTAFERLLAVSLIGMQEPASGGGGSAAAAVAYVG